MCLFSPGWALSVLFPGAVTRMLRHIRRSELHRRVHRFRVLVRLCLPIRILIRNDPPLYYCSAYMY